MRKSRSRISGRPARAVIATAAATVVMLATTATAALASATSDQALTPSVTQIASQGGTSVSFTESTTSTSLSTMSTGPFSAWFTTAASCPANPPSAGATAVLAGTNITGADTVTIASTPPLAIGSWRFCLYDAATTPLLAGHSTVALSAIPFGTPSSPTGATGGGNILTYTATGAFTGTTFATQFNTSPCPDKYATAAGTTIINSPTSTKGATSNTMSITVPTTVAANTGYYICVYAGSTVGTSVIVSRSLNTYGTYASTLPTATVSPANGSSGAANANLTLTAAPGTIPTTGTMGAIFTRNSCPSSNAAPSGDQLAGTVTRISTAKVAVAVSTSVVAGPRDATTAWNVCLYNAQNALILYPAVYTVAPSLDLTGVNNAASLTPSGAAGAASISPAGGPAQGNTTVTISNLAGIPTAAGALLTASLGGVPLTNVTVIDSTSISGVTGPHAAGSVNLTITTAAGTKSTTYTLAATNAGMGVFNYSYAINVTPNTAPPAAVAGTGTNNPYVDITGAGFSALNFASSEITGSAGNTHIASNAHVLLVDNTWYQQGSGVTLLTGTTGVTDPFTTAATPQTQCIGVLVIGDNELVCQLDLADKITGNASVPAVVTDATTAVPPGTYTVAVINSGGSPALLSTSYNYSIVSSGSTFTVSAF
jgi:flagellar hook assembly protein FlgD